MKETQQKQRLLWKDLILRYCRHHRVFVVSAEDADDLPLFHNRAINREPPGGGPTSPTLQLAWHYLLARPCACLPCPGGLQKHNVGRCG